MKRFDLVAAAFVVAIIELFLVGCYSQPASAQTDQPVAREFTWAQEGTSSKIYVTDMPDGSRCYAYAAVGNAWASGCVQGGQIHR